jgi:hypothetical protein
LSPAVTAAIGERGARIPLGPNSRKSSGAGPPLHVARSAFSSSGVNTGTSLSPSFGGLRFAIKFGRGSSGSSVANHLKNC